MRLFLLLFMIFSFQLHAITLKGSLSEFSISPPDDYKLYKEFLGLPYIFLKQEKNLKQTSLSVVPTGINKMALEIKTLEAHYDKYKEGRQKWAQKNHFKITKFHPFSHFENSSKIKVLVAGYEYQKADGGKNIEKSYYVLCSKEAFQLKFLTDISQEVDNKLTIIESSIKNSACH